VPAAPSQTKGVRRPQSQMALPCQTRLLAFGSRCSGVLGAAVGARAPLLPGGVWRGTRDLSLLSLADLSLPGAAQKLDAALGVTGFAIVTSRSVHSDALRTKALGLFRQPLESKQRFSKWWSRGFGSSLLGLGLYNSPIAQ